MKFLAKHKVKAIIFSILVFLYFLVRLPNLTLQPIFADEAIYIRWAQVMRAEPTLRFLPLSDGKTPLFMWVMIPFFKFINDPLFAGRFLSVLSGFFTFLGVFFLSKRIFNLKVAFWACLLYVIVPYTVFFDRMALVDSMLAAFTIWSLYFTLWLMSSLRIDLAMILGYLLGGAILTKTPALMSILFSPISLLALEKGPKDKYPILRATLLLGVSIIIALIMYNLLRLGPNFHLLSSRNSDYIFSTFELKNRPLDPFIPHFHDISDWFPKLFTWPVLILGLVGIIKLFWEKSRKAYVLLLWGLLPLLLEMAFLKTFTARYLLTFVAPFLIFAALGLTKLLEKLPNNPFKILIAIIVILPLALKFDIELINNPPPKDLPLEERKGYFEDWTAGYGFSKMAEYLIEQKKRGNVIVGTAGFFGTLPDGLLYIYLDKADISIIGSTATISAQIRNSAKDHLTYFVGNKRGVGSISEAEIIMEFPKAKPLDGSVQDASVLYQVLP